MKIRKQHFQLLEVMIAIAIVSLCAIPLIYPHIYMTRQQQVLKRELGYDHIANLIYADFVEQLYKNKISLQDIDNATQLPIPHEHFSKMNLPGDGFVVITAPDSKGEGKNVLLKTVVHIHPPQPQKLLEYTYRAFLQKGQPSNQPAPPDEPAEEEPKDEKKEQKPNATP